MLNMQMHQLDVETVFLNAELEPGVDIFIDTPAPLQPPVGKVLRLRRSLYGLKQAPINWNLNINKYLCNELHFKRLEADKCLYVKGSPHEKGDYLILHCMWKI